MSAEHLTIVRALAAYLADAPRTPQGDLAPVARAGAEKIAALAHDPEALAGLGGGGPQEFGELPGHWHAPWEDLSSFAEEDWIAWTLKSGPRKGQSVYKNTKTGKLSDTKPGGKKPAGGGAAKKPAPVKKPPAPAKPTLDSARQKVAALKGADGIDDLAAHLAELHNTDLQALKKELEVKAGGTKAVQALALAKAAYTKATGGGGGGKEPPVKKPGPDKGKPDKGKPGKEEKGPGKPDRENTPEPGEKSPAPTPEPEPPPKGKPQPQPPEPGFTGTDSLGRKWVNGKLVPGEPEPPALPKGAGAAAGYEIRPGRTLDVRSLVGGDPPHIPGKIRDYLKEMGLIRRDQLADRTLDERVIAAHPQKVQEMKARGFIRPLSPHYPDGAQVLTPATAAGVVLEQAYIDNDDPIPDPTTRKGIGVMAALYTGMDDAGKQKILDHLGIKEEAAYYAGYELKEALTAAALAHHNPHVATLVRSDREVHATVDALAALPARPPPGEESDVADFAAGKGVLLGELRKAQGNPHADWWAMDSYIEQARQDLSGAAARRRPAIEQRLAALTGVRDRLDALIRQRQEARGQAQTARHEKVSELLRAHVKDALEVSVTHDPAVGPEARKNVGRAADLLKGAIARPAAGGGDLAYTTYRDTKADGTPNDRAHCNLGDGRINAPERISVEVGIHEILHLVEYSDPGIAAAVQQFRAYRVKDEPGTKMRDRFPGHDYDDDEVGYKDDFDRALDASSAYYAGKRYSDRATELLTIGVEALYKDPAGFARKDPEYASFIVGVLTGKFRSKGIPEA